MMPETFHWPPDSLYLEPEPLPLVPSDYLVCPHCGVVLPDTLASVSHVDCASSPRKVVP